MTRVTSLSLCGALLLSLGVRGVSAQDLTITNVRVIVTPDAVLNQGYIVVRGGRIVSLAPGVPATITGTAVDGRGLTAIAGYIDAHRHVNTGPNEKAQMQALLDAGYTTILSGGGPAEGNITLRDHIEQGVIKGPRIIPTGRLNLQTSTTDQIRAEVRRLAGLGIKFIGEQNLTPKPGPTATEMENLRAAVDESKKVNVWIQIHAVSPQSMMAAVDAGVVKLVHTPHFGWLSFADAKRVAAAGVKQLSTIGFGVPVFGVFADDNKPRFRDGGDWPEKILDGDGRGQEAGYKAVNARTSWDAGVIYGYGTDTNYDPRAGLEHELKSLNLMFSMRDILKLMGPNTASYIEMSKDLGTLEVGKIADIVLLPAHPDDGYWNFLNPKLVIKGGVIVSDRRN